MDNNPGSVNLARKIREIAEAAERQDLGIIDHRPETEGHDWNDVQRALAPQPKPSASPAGTTGHANLARGHHEERTALQLFRYALTLFLFQGAADHEMNPGAAADTSSFCCLIDTLQYVWIKTDKDRCFSLPLRRFALCPGNKIFGGLL
jgi:hypothetical protein